MNYLEVQARKQGDMQTNIKRLKIEQIIMLKI